MKTIVSLLIIGISTFVLINSFASPLHPFSVSDTSITTANKETIFSEPSSTSTNNEEDAPHDDTPDNVQPRDDSLPDDAVFSGVDDPPMNLEIPPTGRETVESDENLKDDSPKELSIEERRDEIRNEFQHAWNAYTSYAWGMDDVRPLSKRGVNSYYMGLTLIDSIDTIIIMGLKDEYQRCRDWVETSFLKGQKSSASSLFETTIRVLGGLLSAFHLSNDKMFIDKAVELADILSIAFETPSGIPLPLVNLRERQGRKSSWIRGASMAEIGTLQLEWQDLSKLSGNPDYAAKVNHVAQKIAQMDRKNGMFTKFMDPLSNRLTDSTITVGAMIDSLYEYFLKQYLLDSGNTEALRMYRETIASIISKLLTKSSPNGLSYFQELSGSKENHRMEHLACFMPGMMALGAIQIPDEFASHLEPAKEVMRTCYEFYARQPTGLSPETVSFESDNDFTVLPRDKHNLLRPETVESLFYLWRATHDPIYREWGWNIFKSFQKHAKLEGKGYSALKDVTYISNADGHDQSNRKDEMESFFLGETMKYLFLLFEDDDVISLDEFVFNTEAHPIRRWKSE